LVCSAELIEAIGFVCIELIHHNPDAVRIRVVNICKFDHPVNPLNRPSFLGDFDGYPASQRLSGDVKSLFPVTFVAVINTSDYSRLSRSGSRSYPRSALLDSSKQITGRFSSYGSW
jgi:hypothetical protein